MNKASGGDGIPVQLFQILKDDAMKVLHSIRQQIWKTEQWPQDWKRPVFIPIPKKGNATECSNYHITAVISHAIKVMLKIFQAIVREPRTPRYSSWIQKRKKNQKPNCQHPFGSQEKQENSRKTSTSASLTKLKPWTVWITTNWEILKEMGIPDHL